MDRSRRRFLLHRLLTVAVVLVGVPTVLSLPSFLDEQPIRAGEESPRTVVAPSLIRVADPEATARARSDAAEAVEPSYRFDAAAVNAVVDEIRDDFAAVREVREPASPDQAEGDEPQAPATPSEQEQIDALRERLPELNIRGIRMLVSLSDNELDALAGETLNIAQQLARQRIREDELEQVLDEQVRVEIAVHDVPDEVAAAVVEPLVRSAMRPTLVIDEEQTEARREAAAESVSEVTQSFAKGSVIVSAGQEVTQVQLAALERAGLAGSNPRWQLLRALGIVIAALAVVSLYLRLYRPKIWRSNRRLLLLATLVFGYAVVLGAVVLSVDQAASWYYAIPVGALGMLATILLGAPVGVLAAVPVTLLTAFVVPDSPGVIAFAAAATLVSVPFASRLSARGDLRRATTYAGAGYIALAAVMAAVFDGIDVVPVALLAGAVHGVLAAVIVVGGLPFMESAFGIVTATSLIDLADRNHPLLRELEKKALGSYNHSIMVATLVERACRSINADGLLGSVAALYHDIGKVRRPYFFVENQFGMSNPHDELEPEVSALIIQDHVKDGVKMARSFRLPPEVVEGIATHHGTTLVTYFYLQAIRTAGSDDSIDERAFRYKGRKPSTKETAVLMLADCCEAASRAAAQNDRNLSRDALEEIVEALFADRVDDGQLDESPLTFQDLASVKASFIETLVGVYHPRITYPDDERKPRPAPSILSEDGPGAPPERAAQPEPAAVLSQSPLGTDAPGGNGEPGSAAPAPSPRTPSQQG